MAVMKITELHRHPWQVTLHRGLQRGESKWLQTQLGIVEIANRRLKQQDLQ